MNPHRPARSPASFLVIPPPKQSFAMQAHAGRSPLILTASRAKKPWCAHRRHRVGMSVEAAVGVIR